MIQKNQVSINTVKNQVSINTVTRVSNLIDWLPSHSLPCVLRSWESMNPYVRTRDTTTDYQKDSMKPRPHQTHIVSIGLYR